MKKTKSPKVKVDAAEPKKTIKKGLEIGDTGTEILQGIINEEYNTDLQGIRAYQTFDEMRKSDGTVKAALLSVTLPIRRAKWFVKPATEDEADVKVAEFVSRALFDWQSMTWDDIVRQALLMLPFGVMAFEKVFEMRNYDGVDYITWAKFAPRLPKSIQKWQLDSGEMGIQQRKQDGQIAEIPIEKLLIFTHEKEGDNWEGVSILRPVYKHWHIKNTFYKIDAIAFERQGIGIPFAKLPTGYSDQDRSRAEEILKNIRAHHQAHVLIPDGWEFGFLDMNAKSTRDPKESIQHHNREIAKSVLAQFLELGATDSGSRALSSDQSEMFLYSLEAVANNIRDVINTHAIQQIVDYNFDVKEYPTLEYTGIAKTDVEKISNAYKTLIDSGAVIVGSNDEQYFREMLGLPEREEGDEPADDGDGVDDEENPDDILDDENNMSEHHHVKKKFDDAFKPTRKLTFAEQKVDFEAMQRTMDKLEASLDEKTKALLHAEREKYIAALTKAVNAGNKDAIKAATLKLQSDYAAILKEHMKQAYEYGKMSAANEMKIAAPSNPKEILNQIDIQSDAIADMHVNEITNASKTAMVNAMNKGESVAAALAAADAIAAKKIDELVRNTTQIVMSGYINTGRNDVFKANSKKIYALQRSEILDFRTCNYCLSIDGRIIEKDDKFANNTIFHSGCRGIWVEIMLDEETLPPIGGIPKSLRDRFGDAVNDLIQPKNPETTKDSLARKEAEKRLKRQAKRKKK